jgi:hypothetical protein
MSTWSGAWDRSSISAFGAPPKKDLKIAVSASTYRQNSATIRRAPNERQQAMLRKCRNFALHKFAQLHPEAAAGGEDAVFAELCVMPPRELAEVRAEWVGAALREAGALPEQAYLAHALEVSEPEQQGGGAGAVGVVRRLGINYRELPMDGWPSTLILKMPTLGALEHPALAEEQGYYHTELTFLTRSVPALAPEVQAKVVTPKVFWSFCRPPDQVRTTRHDTPSHAMGPCALLCQHPLRKSDSAPPLPPPAAAQGERGTELRPHWKWAKGRFPEYPFVLGEYCCLLEDLAHYHASAADAELTLETATAIVHSLAALHGAFWEHEQLSEPCYKPRHSTDLSEVREVIAATVARGQLDQQVADMLVAALAIRCGCVAHGCCRRCDRPRAHMHIATAATTTQPAPIVTTARAHRSQLPVCHARAELLEEVRRHGKTLTRGASVHELGGWILLPGGHRVSSMSWGETCVGCGAHDRECAERIAITWLRRRGRQRCCLSLADGKHGASIALANHLHVWRGVPAQWRSCWRSRSRRSSRRSGRTPWSTPTTRISPPPRESTPPSTPRAGS